MFPRTKHLLIDDTGTTTVEYAIMTVVAAVLAGVLYTIVSGESVVTALEGLVQSALSIDV